MSVSWGEHGDTWWTEAMDGGNTPHLSDFADVEGPCRCSRDSPCECPRVCDDCGRLSQDVGADGICERCALASEDEPEEVLP